jgi:hypothetical protein
MIKKLRKFERADVVPYSHDLYTAEEHAGRVTGPSRLGLLPFPEGPGIVIVRKDVYGRRVMFATVRMHACGTPVLYSQVSLVYDSVQKLLPYLDPKNFAIATGTSK